MLIMHIAVLNYILLKMLKAFVYILNNVKLLNYFVTIIYIYKYESG